MDGSPVRASPRDPDGGAEGTLGFGESAGWFSTLAYSNQTQLRRGSGLRSQKEGRGRSGGEGQAEAARVGRFWEAERSAGWWAAGWRSAWVRGFGLLGSDLCQSQYSNFHFSFFYFFYIGKKKVGLV